MKIHIFNKNTNIDTLASGFTAVCNLYFYMLVIPFKILRGSESLEGSLIRLDCDARYRKVTCSIVNCFLLISIIGATKSAVNRSSSLLEVTSEVSAFLQVFSVLHFAWGKRSEFEQFLQLIDQYPYFNAKFKAIGFIICGQVLQFAVNFMYQFNNYKEIWNNGPNFMCELLFKCSSGGLATNVLRVLAIGGDVLLRNTIGITDYILFFLGFTLLQTVKSLQTRIDTKGPSTVRILNEYQKIIDITTIANRIFATQIFINYLAILLTYANVMNCFLSPGYILKKLVLLPFIVWSAGTWLLIAEFHRLMGASMKTWIYTNKDNIGIPDSKLIILSAEIHGNQVGIECRFFTVTYGLLTSMLGVILTYGIILFQLKST